MVNLKKKYQPQWHFKSEKDVREDLRFQKRYNPRTYKWLMKKDIKVGGKRISTKQVMKSKKRRRQSRGLFDFRW